MSRGGRGGGGGGGGAGRMNGIPFDIDPKLEEEMNAFRENERQDDDDWHKTLYPPMNVNLPPPPTEKEKRAVNVWRQHREAMRKGPFFMDTPLTGKRDLAAFNAFEDVATYSNKRNKRAGGLPNLKRLPIVKECLPKELWDVVDDDDDEEGGDAAEAPKKNLAFLKKKRLDKLAQFDDGADIDTVNVDDDDDQANQDEDGGDGVEIPEDDDYSEDDDDAGNDYNAEKYFDDGDGADDDGDDGGGEDAWQRERVADEAPTCGESDTPHAEGFHKKIESKGVAELKQAHRYHRGQMDYLSEKQRAWDASDTLDSRAKQFRGLLPEPADKPELTWKREPWHGAHKKGSFVSRIG